VLPAAGVLALAYDDSKKPILTAKIRTLDTAIQPGQLLTGHQVFESDRSVSAANQSDCTAEYATAVGTRYPVAFDQRINPA
jgi:hypothetical protein